MIPGTFVPFHPTPLKGRRSARVGWVVAENGCHIWQGHIARGYGRVNIGGRARPAHRVRYEREVGPIPEGMELDHFVCENRACCNPAHVRPVTQRENMLRSDGITAVNLAKTHCKHGHPLSGDNLKLVQRGRECRECRRNISRAAWERRKLAQRTGQ